MGEHRADYEEALSAEEWRHLCKFLKMDLIDVLALPGPELLRLTVQQIERNARGGLIGRILRSSSRASKKGGPTW